MKRKAELHTLSREHRDGLIHARHLSRAGAGAEPVEPAVAGFMAAWEAVLLPHFRIEEEVLLPLFDEAGRRDDPLAARLLAEHAALRAAVRALPESAGAERQRQAGELGRALHDHIRFEERELFPALEAAVPDEAWERAGPLLGGPHPPAPSPSQPAGR